MFFHEGKYLYLGACHSVWNFLVTQTYHHGGVGGVSCAWQGDLDTCCLVFLTVSVSWTHLGYFLMNGTTLHLRVEVRCMHHIEHDWLELWKSWWLVVNCLLDWCIFVYDYGICYYFLSNHGHLMFVDFFYNKLTIAILYCVVGNCGDCEPLFVGVDEHQ